MSLLATYVSTSSLTVDGEHTDELITTRILKCVGATGTPLVEVVSSIYRLDTDDTLCSVSPALLTVGLTSIELGPSFSDSATQRTNMSPHDHTNRFGGGEIASAVLTAEEIQTIQMIPVPVAGDDNKVLAYHHAGPDFVAKSVLGTTNQIVVTHAAGSITISLAASLTGVLFGTASALSALASATAKAGLRRNAANDGYEFAVPIFADPSDVADTVESGKATGDLFFRAASGNVDRLAISATEGDVLTVASGVPAWAAAPEGGGSGSSELDWFYMSSLKGCV